MGLTPQSLRHYLNTYRHRCLPKLGQYLNSSPLNPTVRRRLYHFRLHRQEYHSDLMGLTPHQLHDYLHTYRHRYLPKLGQYLKPPPLNPTVRRCLYRRPVAVAHRPVAAAHRHHDYRPDRRRCLPQSRHPRCY